MRSVDDIVLNAANEFWTGSGVLMQAHHMVLLRKIIRAAIDESHKAEQHLPPYDTTPVVYGPSGKNLTFEEDVKIEEMTALTLSAIATQMVIEADGAIPLDADDLIDAIKDPAACTCKEISEFHEYNCPKFKPPIHRYGHEFGDEAFEVGGAILLNTPSEKKEPYPELHPDERSPMIPIGEIEFGHRAGPNCKCNYCVNNP